MKRYLTKFDYVNSMTIDDLHSIYLGLTKKITDLLLKAKAFGNEDSFDKMDDFLEQNHGVSEISSIKSFIKIGDWKGKDFMNWLLYYGVPFLKEFIVIGNIYFENFKSLCNLTYLLSKKYLYSYDILAAKQELEIFVETYAIYGNSNKIPNFHELSHIIESFEQCGPLYNYSTFNFERLNFELRKCVRSSLKPELQISRRLGSIKLIESEMELNKNNSTIMALKRKMYLEKCCKRPESALLFNNLISQDALFLKQYKKKNFIIETEAYSSKFLKKELLYLLQRKLF